MIETYIDVVCQSNSTRVDWFCVGGRFDGLFNMQYKTSSNNQEITNNLFLIQNILTLYKTNIISYITSIIDTDSIFHDNDDMSISQFLHILSSNYQNYCVVIDYHQ